MIFLSSSIVATILQKQELPHAMKVRVLFFCTLLSMVSTYRTRKTPPHYFCKITTAKKKKKVIDLTDNHSQLFSVRRCKQDWLKPIWELEMLSGQLHSEIGSFTKWKYLSRMFAWKFRKLKAHYLLRNCFLQKALLEPHYILAPLSYLHNLCHGPLYQTIPGLFPFIQFFKNRNWI